MDYQPLFDRLLIKPIAEEEVIKGIFIPANSSNLKKGKVLAAGPGKPGMPMTVKEGSVVLYKKDDGYPITLDEEELLILLEKDAYLTVSEKKQEPNY